MIIEKIKKYVEDECRKETNKQGMTPFHHHFKDVVKYGSMLARKTGADEEVVLLAAWLHDIGSIQGDYENHHLSGANEAGRVLRLLGYPEEKIKMVEHCIVAHRGSKDIPRETIEAECIADADAMSHLDEIDSLFYMTLVLKNMKPDEAKIYIRDKIRRSYNKLTDRAKEIIQTKYDSLMIVLE